MIHLPDCSVGLREGEVCSNPHKLSDGVNHWWSGWPGAYCLGCGASDPNEECLSCMCSCHDEFWRLYEKEMSKKDITWKEK